MNNLYIIEEQPNPSVDYFVHPAIKNTKLNIINCGFKDLPDQVALNGAIIIFVRYIPHKWAKLIEASRDHIKQIIFFMDDDLLDIKATRRMPLNYQLKIFSLATKFKSIAIFQ